MTQPGATPTEPQTSLNDVTPHHFAENIQRASEAKDNMAKALRLIDQIQQSPTSARKLAIAKTHLETAYLWMSEWWEFSDAPLTYSFPESEHPR